MSNIPAQLHYATSHEWIKVDGDIGTVGISDHAQAELSDVVFVDLPKVGAKATAGAVIAVVESVKAASVKKPELVNKDPYGAAWLFKLKLSAPDEVAKLMDAAAYQAQIGE